MRASLIFFNSLKVFDDVLRVLRFGLFGWMTTTKFSNIKGLEIIIAWNVVKTSVILGCNNLE
jgi:hypothetical protein